MTPGKPLLRFDKVCRHYGHGETTVRALDKVDLTIAHGEFVAIMGPSGSGKSTAMNILGCLDLPTDGHFFFRGVDVGGLSADQRALLRRTYIGFVFQGFNLLKRTTALENVELPLVYRGLPVRARRERAVRALAAVGLEERLNHTSAELSGGQQQRVAIARAIASEPSVLFADEPTGNLDSERSNEIMGLLRDLNQSDGLTVVVVTHETDMADYARRHIHFLDGRIDQDTVQGEPACS
jgi:putative ABC transport system ATP-binding protein